MNVVKEDFSEKQRKLRIFYITIISICVLAILIALIIQITHEIFVNKVNYLENNAYKINKINETEEIVYLGYQNKERKINDYELDVNIPYINIKNEVIDEFNKQIKDIFEQKVKSVLNTQNNNVIYTVKYSAYVSNNIL